MPRGDGTGPQGWGRLTGRRLGRCTGNNLPDYRPGFGSRLRLGGGRGYGYGYRGAGYAGDYLPHFPQTSAAQQAEINRQIGSVIDQLSELLKRSTESGEMNNETQ